MEEIMQLVHRKSQLIYDINCIKGYMDTWEFNNYLTDTWDQMNKELKDVSGKIEELSKPPFKEFEQQRFDLMKKINAYEQDLNKLRKQLEELDETVLKIRRQYTNDMTANQEEGGNRNAYE